MFSVLWDVAMDLRILYNFLCWCETYPGLRERVKALCPVQNVKVLCLQQVAP